MKFLICVSILISLSWSGDWTLDPGRADYKWLKNPSSAGELAFSGGGIAQGGALSEVGRAPHSFDSTSKPGIILYRSLLPSALGMSIDGVKMGQRFSSWGTWLDAKFLTVDQLDGYDEWGRSTSEFGSGAWAFGLGVQTEYFLKMGASVYWLHSQIDSYSSNGALVNASIAYGFDFGTQLAFGVNHIGFGSAYREREIIPPMKWQLGLSHELNYLRFAISPAADFIFRNDEDPSVALSLKTVYAEILSLNLGSDLMRTDFLPSAGIGLHLGWLDIEYAFGGHEYLGGSHLFQVGLFL